MRSTTKRHFLNWSLFAVLMLVSVILNLPLYGQELTDAAASASVTFKQQKTPAAGIGSFLFAISGDSRSDIWAVGPRGDGSIGLHFNGTKWAAIKMALPDSANMSGVSVLSPNDAWAVGTAFDTTTQHFTSVIQHFDGTKWSVVPSPHFASGDQLFAVKAIASNDVFAVGDSHSDNQKPRPLIEHFDGTQWTVIAAPALKAGQTQSLRNIDATSHNDVWVTGFDEPNFLAAILHFDGHKFRNVPFPSLSKVGFGQIAAISANDAWVVGSQGASTGRATLAAHWDGKSWTIVPSPNVSTTNSLGGVSARSSTDVWAVGCGDFCGQDTGLGTILVEHWDGQQWSINPTPLIGNGDIVSAILALPSGDIFLAGTESSQAAFASALILHGKE